MSNISMSGIRDIQLYVVDNCTIQCDFDHQKSQILHPTHNLVQTILKLFVHHRRTK